MTEDLKEATPIGRLVGAGSKTLAWVYRWNSMEISILWLSDVPDPVSIIFMPRPGCDHATCKDVNGLLRTLRTDGDKD